MVSKCLRWNNVFNNLNQHPDLARRTAQDEIAYGASRYRNILVGAKNVNLSICNHNTRLGDILNSVLRSATFASDSANGTGEMISFQHLDILENTAKE